MGNGGFIKLVIVSFLEVSSWLQLILVGILSIRVIINWRKEEKPRLIKALCGFVASLLFWILVIKIFL